AFLPYLLITGPFITYTDWPHATIMNGVVRCRSSTSSDTEVLPVTAPLQLSTTL
ncbi:hypothetical protein J6590_042343, partial [Homalodisca vitripennis]